jgi:hypothetical protein
MGSPRTLELPSNRDSGAGACRRQFRGWTLLDLQAPFHRAYDAGPYRKAIHYGEDPIKPRLRPEPARWVESILRPAGPEGSP